MTEMADPMLLLIRGAREVVRVAEQEQRYKVGPTDMNELHVMRAAEGSTGLSIAVQKDGKIAAISSDEEMSERFTEFEETIDAAGCSVVPGLVDGHTHPVWAGDRVHEFALKMAGASYMEVQKAGGGIHFTVRKTTEASEKELLALVIERFQKMAKSGTTLVEAKSGYGLTGQEEVRQLKVLHEAARSVPISVVPTFLGAHAVPTGMDAEEATRRVIEEHLPALKDARDKGQITVENVDVFCETGVYNVEQTSRIVRAAKDQLGLMVNVHVDELTSLKGGKMAGDLGAEAASHCECVTDEDIEAMAAGGTTAVLLPTTQLLLRLPPPPARDMIKKGVIVALGSDFNPNAHCLSMSTVLHLACVLLHMSPAEALVAATINAAHSLRRSHLHGSLQPGKMADMVIIEAPRWEHLVYQLGEHSNIIKHVVCKGLIIHTRPGL